MSAPQSLVWILVEHEYDTYSYSGIVPYEEHVHATEEGARQHAADLGLTIVEYIRNPNTDATLHSKPLLP